MSKHNREKIRPGTHQTGDFRYPVHGDRFPPQVLIRLKEKIYYSFQNQYIIFLIDWFKERSPFGWGRAVDVMIGLFRP